MTRHARLLLVVLFLVASMLVGALGDVAGAARSDDPSSGTTPPADTGDGTGTTDPPASFGAPTAAADAVQVTRGSSATVNLLGNDSCQDQSPCAPAAVDVAIGGSIAGVTPTYDAATGILTLSATTSATLGAQALSYVLTERDLPHRQASASISVTVVNPPPDHFNPPQGTLFTHPFRKAYRNRIYNQIIRTINSVPAGGQIRIASWSFSSKPYYTALNRARLRGVSVQIVLAQRNTPKVSDYRTLTKLFGTNRSAGSWVYKCSYSCRGSVKGATMHSKIFLFSQAAGTQYITMTGSANLTTFAVTGQWNHMNTITNNAEIYNQALSVFNQMYQDRPAPYVEQHVGPYWMYYYPRGGIAPKNDYLMQALNGVRCRGAVGAAAGGRTQIRIAIYAWYENRGRWLAKKVRSLWDQGCDIRIVYGIVGNGIKNTLYSPKGRGRIPMRQIMLTNKAGDPIYYIHDKFVAINGHVGSVPNASFAMQGSFNFSDLGFGSDENVQRLTGRSFYNQFRTDFDLLWKDKQARAPSPTSVIKNVERTAATEPRLGTGRYTYMEAD